MLFVKAEQEHFACFLSTVTLNVSQQQQHSFILKFEVMNSPHLKQLNPPGIRKTGQAFKNNTFWVVCIIGL